MKRLVVILIVFIALVFLFFRWQEVLEFPLRFFSNFKPSIQNSLFDIASSPSRQISVPPPLRSEKEVAGASLTRSGVILWTNEQRKSEGLDPLEENEKLNQVAALKAQDMFNKQYFSHVSPSGEGIEDLAEKTDYEFINLGENLALGNFESDKALVQAWMESPGHRANILNPKYEEIGVAVQKGFFEGREVWIAVQEFGFPLSSCSMVDENLKIQIEQNEGKLQDLEEQIVKKKQELDSMRPKSGQEYNQKVEEYNNLVSQYNNLVLITKEMIAQYNSQVVSFNLCASK